MICRAHKVGLRMLFRTTIAFGWMCLF